MRAAHAFANLGLLSGLFTDFLIQQTHGLPLVMGLAPYSGCYVTTIILLVWWETLPTLLSQTSYSLRVQRRHKIHNVPSSMRNHHMCLNWNTADLQLMNWLLFRKRPQSTVKSISLPVNWDVCSLLSKAWFLSILVVVLFVIFVVPPAVGSFQTVRHVSTRIKEHAREGSPVSENFRASDVRVTMGDVELVDSSRHIRTSMTLEAIYIRRRKPLLNTRDEYRSRRLHYVF